MSLLEQRIRRYEHARWTTDNNRRVFPFEWGLEHVGGGSHEPDPRRFLNAWVDQTLASSEEWFAAEPADDYVLHSILCLVSNSGIFSRRNVLNAFKNKKKCGNCPAYHDDSAEHHTYNLCHRLYDHVSKGCSTGKGNKINW